MDWASNKIFQNQQQPQITDNQINTKQLSCFI
jgi:hypothetical protein